MCEKQATNACAGAKGIAHSTGTALESEWSGIGSGELQRLAARLVAARRVSLLWESEIRPPRRSASPV